LCRHAAPNDDDDDDDAPREDDRPTTDAGGATDARSADIHLFIHSFAIAIEVTTL